MLAHRAHLVETGQLEKRRERRLARELEEIVSDVSRSGLVPCCEGRPTTQLYVDVLARRTDPWSASERLLDALD